MNQVHELPKEKSWYKHPLKSESLILLIPAVVLTLASALHYLSSMATLTDPGFVFDDCYIHLQFARTIFEGEAWQYNPGELSTGSTSPLWSIILSPLFLFTTDPTSLIWGVYVISALLYISSTFLVGKISLSYTSSITWSVIAMLGFVFVPRNTLLMISGMETPLFVFLVLLSIILLDRMEPRFDPIIGAVIGLAFLARPEGVLLALVCVPARFMILAVRRKINRQRIIPMVSMVGLMAIIASIWVLFCLSTTGQILPATFYAKSGVVTPNAINLWNNHWTGWYWRYPYLLLGIIMGIVLVVYKKPHPWLFALSLAITYRLTFPFFALINHARYLVPVFDLFVVTFVIALGLLQKESVKVGKDGIANNEKARTDKGVKILAIAIVCFIVFATSYPQYFDHADLHALEVKNTNERQVIIGKWIRENTPEDAVLAIHDAGALRFFSERRIIDLAGLISPDITFGNMTRPEKLVYLKEEGCEYFVFFDRLFYNWAYHLVGAYTVLYEARIPDCVIPSNANMSVYFINWSLSRFS
ncbi:MAG: hypothetical protein ACXADC_05370 [Candidatus Thorarchaeota archaeon]|jgi:hypothetical protein